MSVSWKVLVRSLRASVLLASLCAVAAGSAVFFDRSATAGAPPPTRPELPLGPGAPVVGGLAPMPAGAEVPPAWMPPGSSASELPSEEIFPAQQITLRFNHKKHVKGLKLTCDTCHAARKSAQASDRLLPQGATCDACHDVDHQDPAGVKAGTDPNGQCAFCHLGAGSNVAPVHLPQPNLTFSHSAHLTRNIGCAQCHGAVEELELATRDQLPRMAGCFTCHNMTGAAQGGAKSECRTCHVGARGGRLQTVFASGQLLPPRWLHNAGHGPDWIDRHKRVAADDSAFCGNCHSDDECTNCHDGKTRPRTVHPNDWISMHPQAARQDSPRCTSCHQQQTFCADCHRRIGIARDGPLDRRANAGRFHPPPAVWTRAPRSQQHHAWEAQRNLNACVSCHSERDCTTCHAAKGVPGGAGISPHPPGFAAQCEGPLRRNPRPCLACHEANAPSLRVCR